MTNPDDCMFCSKYVSNRMHGIRCDGCQGWQHRKCNTGITYEQYRKMQKGELEREWKCESCQNNDNQQHTFNVLEDLIPDAVDMTASPIRVLNTTYVRSPIDAMETSFGDENTGIEDRTFDIQDRTFDLPQQILDRSLPDRPLDDEILPESPVTYEIVEKGSKRGGRKLISSDGFSYNARRSVVGGRTYWTCSKRSKTLTCYASVKQFGTMFTASVNGHNHPADPGVSSKVKVSAKVKEVASQNLFKPAAHIVEDVMKELTTREDVNLPKIDALTRAANLHRQKMRPKEPESTDFEIDQDFIGREFIVDDIRVDEQRHIMFATKDQLHHLQQARRWFIDGTFKLVRRPFYQLMTIHAFVKKGEDTKQVPLVYILMSRRSKQDYIAVLTSIRQKLQRPLVELMKLVNK